MTRRIVFTVFKQDKLKHLLAGKELIWDYGMNKGTPEFMDFMATLTGGVVTYIIVNEVIGR